MRHTGEEDRITIQGVHYSSMTQTKTKENRDRKIANTEAVFRTYKLEIRFELVIEVYKPFKKKK